MRPTTAIAAPIAALIAAGTLAGCVATAGSGSTASFPPTDPNRASLAYQACAKAIAGQTARPLSDITIVQYLYAEAATTILANVKGAEAPWKCIASNGGVVQQVMYTGSEGAL